MDLNQIIKASKEYEFLGNLLDLTETGFNGYSTYQQDKIDRLETILINNLSNKDERIEKFIYQLEEMIEEAQNVIAKRVNKVNLNRL